MACEQRSTTRERRRGGAPVRSARPRRWFNVPRLHPLAVMKRFNRLFYDFDSPSPATAHARAFARLPTCCVRVNVHTAYVGCLIRMFTIPSMKKVESGIR